EALGRAVRSKDNCHRRSRTIYYDTDNIHENQIEEIRICDQCAGALRIESSADRSRPILAVHIPVRACPACQDQGQRWFESADPVRYAHTYLQDRKNDRYIHKKPSAA
ncbi:MAG: hypothetical protein P8Z73_15335, partial [Desulfobacteraceae bacterium]